MHFPFMYLIIEVTSHGSTADKTVINPVFKLGSQRLLKYAIKALVAVHNHRYYHQLTYGLRKNLLVKFVTIVHYYNQIEVECINPDIEPCTHRWTCTDRYH